MATGAGKKQSREARERTRAYQARQEFHEGQVARRRRDNLVAGIAGGVLILAAVGGQIAYYTLGPGAPEPTATATATPTASITSSPTP
ncbi:MAG: dioxygenase [Microbacterium sp.]